MKIIMVGTGGVGGYFGAKLLQAGEDVTFVTTSRSHKILQEQGLTIKKPDRDLHLTDLQVTDSFGIKADLLILAVKTHQLADIVEIMDPSVTDQTIILPLLNGINATRLLREKYGKQAIGGLCRLLCYKERPGILHYQGSGSIDIGELDGPVSDRIKAISRLFENAGIPTSSHDDFVTAQWDKMVFISMLGALGSVTRANFGELRAISETKDLFRKLIEEGVDVARKQGAKLDYSLVDKLLGWLEHLPASGTTSTQRDIISGRPSELHFLLGDIVELGEELDIPTSKAIYYSLLPQEKKARENIDL